MPRRRKDLLVMRLLADENIGRGLIVALRLAGYDVLSIKEQMPGTSDADVLETAQSQERVVITQDKDFGELAVRYGLPAGCGIILFRMGRSYSGEDPRRIVEILKSRHDWPGHFTVVDDDKIRMRVLPSPPVR